ncbi:MAG: tRNA-dihydrouridine synthase [Phycisphaerae bacterium]|jgi:nifR3 family TIM-barrel protein
MLKIGPVQLDVPLSQAALAGYSDLPMRLIARRLGAPYALHEVVLDRSLTHAGKFQRKVLTLCAEDHPVGGQVIGATPAEFAEAAALLAESGFDVVDINFGCPVKKVLGRCRGGYLLSDVPQALEILRRVREAVPPAVPVTVKMRRGMDDSAESERDFFRIFDAAFELGLAAVTVHGRTVRQRYMGAADWGFLARVKRHAGAGVVLGSGDLFTADDIARMLSQTGVDGVSVARGCIGNPWIFREARAVLAGQPLPEPPTVAEQGRVIREHFDLVEQLHGPKIGPKVMRKFGIRYAKRHPFPARVRAAFINVKSREEWESAWREWYDPTRAWPPGRHVTGPDELIAAGASP